MGKRPFGQQAAKGLEQVPWAPCPAPDIAMARVVHPEPDLWVIP